jgi:hypothetical protein
MAPPHDLTARELAREAGYLIRPMPTGGAVERVYPFGRVLELGPDATDAEILALAARALICAALTEPGPVAPARTALG